MAVTPPRQGEVWLAHLDPTVGAEIKKTRPVVILTNDRVNNAALHVSLCVPTTTTPRADGIRVELTDDDGVKRISYAIALQTRALSHDRLTRRIGKLPAVALSELQHTLMVFTRPSA